MGRLTRAQAQERNRARVLAAARQEFAERGFRDAKIDSIAERAELTRGAVYSNFPGKRALYFTILAQDAERAGGLAGAEPGHTPAQALGALARAWLAGLPLAAESDDTAARLGSDLLPEIQASEPTRTAFGQLLKLDAVLLGLGLERLARSPARLVRTAEAALLILYGAGQMAAAAPGYGDPFDISLVCERLVGLDLGDRWDPPHLPYVPAARPADDSWAPPPAADAVRARARPSRGRRRGDGARAAPARGGRGSGTRRAARVGRHRRPGHRRSRRAGPPSPAGHCRAQRLACAGPSRPRPGRTCRWCWTRPAAWPGRRACRPSVTSPRRPSASGPAGSSPEPRGRARATRRRPSTARVRTARARPARARRSGSARR